MGFPSPALDHLGPVIDLNRILLTDADETFLFKMKGDGMDHAPGHIRDGDLLAVNTSLTPVPGMVVVVMLKGELVIRRLNQHHQYYSLMSDNPKFGDIEIVENLDNVKFWGIVSHFVHSLI